jgi:pimeloyl-ACP methyl ester carboxylesterase
MAHQAVSLSKPCRRQILLFGGACLLAVTGQSASAAPFDRARLGNASVRIDRGFARVGYGQLHYRVARPLDEASLSGAPPVLCLHQTPNSSQVFIEFMADLARDRVVYAVDTPGLGESDLPRRPPEIEDYATAMIEFLDAKGLNQVNVVGYHTGASIAATMAAMAPDRVGALMLAGLALFNDEERAGFFEQPWPKPREADGRHLLSEWERSHKWRGKGQSDASVERTFMQKMAAGTTAWWGARAVMRHDLEAVLTQLNHPLLVVNTRDDLFTVTPRVAALKPGIEIETLEAYGFGVFEVIPERLAGLARTLFDS